MTVDLKMRRWVIGLSLALLVSMTLAWNERIDDPWGLLMVLFSTLGLTTAIVISARRTARRAQERENL